MYGPITIENPVSSITSRNAQAIAISFSSNLPFGNDQSSYFGRCISATSNSSLSFLRQTMAPAASTLELIIVSIYRLAGRAKKLISCREHLYLFYAKYRFGLTPTGQYLRQNTLLIQHLALLCVLV